MEAAVHLGRFASAAASSRNDPIQLRLAYTAIGCSARWSSPNAPLSSARLKRSSAGAWGRLHTMSSMILPSGPPGAGGGRRRMAPRRA